MAQSESFSRGGFSSGRGRESSGFGSSRGGGRGGSNNGRGGGFGQSNDNQESSGFPSRGGFGSRGSFGQSNEENSAFGSTRGRGGFNQNGGGGRTCYKCQGEGHMARECPNVDSAGGSLPSGYYLSEDGRRKE
uniref:CCHC-type domain-containing protein n=1 Tax=Panagrolaimus sp. PS1159 TaxID=55785 RepID=A0AC35EVW2_9BILA